jgi:hypothetical protein
MAKNKIEKKNSFLKKSPKNGNKLPKFLKL